MDDPTEIPEIRSSHKVRPPIGPYRNLSQKQMEEIVLASIEEIVDKPWPGDRLSEGLMRSLLTCFWYILNDIGYYERPDPDQDTPPRRTRSIHP